jgi:hypothetical protein
MNIQAFYQKRDEKNQLALYQPCPALKYRPALWNKAGAHLALQDASLRLAEPQALDEGWYLDHRARYLRLPGHDKAVILI